MITTVEEVKKLNGVPAPPRRGYFSAADFARIAEALPDHHLELLGGELVINKRAPHEHFSIADFKAVAAALPEHRLELLKGEIKMSPPPDKRHQKHSLVLTRLFRRYGEQIEALGCELAVANCFFEVPDELVRQFQAEQKPVPSDVCPDGAIVYFDYWDTERVPPALLVVEVLSFSNRENLERDTITKPEIYAALAIPAYWIIDRRDESVLVYTEPRAGRYTVAARCTGAQLLPAPGLEFLQITPAQLFAA